MDVTLGGGPGVILATWAENHHFARIGTFLQGTPTATVTGTPPTATRTPTATATVCGSNTIYSIATATGATVVPGTTDIGNHTDDGHTLISLPFPFALYGQTFTTASINSNGNMGFTTPEDSFTNTCLPDLGASNAIFPHWDDQCTGPCSSSTCTGCGIFTSVSGTAPNRIFNIEWKTNYFNTNTALDYEVRLYENSATARFDVIYGAVPNSGSSATVGVQKGAGPLFTQYECNTGGLSSGLMLTFTQPPCNAPTPTVAATFTPTPTATSTVCPIQFSDVPNPSTFYAFIRCLACRNIVNGYSDGTFRPNNNVTRGQLSKIVSNSAGFTEPQPTQMFEDVPLTGPGSTFQPFIGRLASRGYISGYPCGGVGEPCVHPQDRPYFRPNNNATRGQISKIDSNAAGFVDPPSGQQFQDVAPALRTTRTPTGWYHALSCKGIHVEG